MRTLSNSQESVTRRILILLLCAAIPMTGISLYSFLHQPNTASASIFYQAFGDQYMDFFNCIIDGSDLKVYQSRQSSLYPPLANLMYYGMSRFIPQSLLEQGSTAIRASREGRMLFWIFQGGTTLLLLALIAWAVPGKRWEKGLACLMTAASLPILYATERGNCVALTAALLIVYLVWLHDPSPWKREVGFICLAISANLKLYPALFGLIPLLEKRYRESVRLMIYGGAMFGLPMVLVYGIRSIVNILINLRFTFAVQINLGLGYKISWVNFSHLLNEAFGLPMFSGIHYVLMILCLISLLFLPDYGDRIMVITLMCVGFSDFSMVYNTLFFIPALIVYMREGKEDGFTPLTILLMAVSLFPLAVGGLDPFPELCKGTMMRLNISTLIDCAAVMLLTLVMIGKAGRNAVRTVRGKQT